MNHGPVTLAGFEPHDERWHRQGVSVIEHCSDQLQPMLALLRELVEQNSYSGNRAGGAIVATMLARELAAIDGIEVELVESERFAPHVIAYSHAASHTADGCVGLVGHHDTVFPPGTFEGFCQDGDIVRGPGVLDMKGGLTVCITALRLLSEAKVLPNLPLRFVIVSDEEVGSPEGADVLDKWLRGAACSLTFEAGRAHDAIITARKGTGGLRVMASGKATHAGNHHREGANAIWALSKLIDEAQGFTDYERGMTVSVGHGALIAGMLASGCISTLSRKAAYTTEAVGTEDASGHPCGDQCSEKLFRCPWTLGLVMFLGESMCLLWFAVRRCRQGFKKESSIKGGFTKEDQVFKKEGSHQ